MQEINMTLSTEQLNQVIGSMKYSDIKKAHKIIDKIPNEYKMGFHFQLACCYILGTMNGVHKERQRRKERAGIA